MGGGANASRTGVLIALALLLVMTSAVFGESMGATSIFVTVTIVGWLGCQVDSVLGELLENKGYIGKHTVNFLATLSGVAMAVVVAFRIL